MVRIASPDRGTAGISSVWLQCTFFRPGRPGHPSLSGGTLVDTKMSVVGRFACGLPFHALLLAIPIGHLHDRGELGSEVRMQRTQTVTPRPVAGGSGRFIHPRFAAQMQNVLEREDARV